MQFLTEEETRLIARKYKMPAADRRRKARITYDTGLKSYRRIAGPIVQEIGPFEKALLWINDIIFGDSYEAGKIGNALWQGYYDWRRRHGDDRRLHDARVAVFGGTEADLLAEAMTFAIVLACDAHVMARPGKTFLKISHDDYIDVISGVTAREIIARMEKLGCKVWP